MNNPDVRVGKNTRFSSAGGGRCVNGKVKG